MKPGSEADELMGALKACRGFFVSAALFSLAINLLYLAAPIYMLQVYDRVITSGSTATLVMLTIALLFAFLTLAGLDAVRARILTRCGIRLDRLLAARVIASAAEKPVSGLRSQSLRDFDKFRQFITGPGVIAIFDLPWAPIYIGVIFLLHPLLGAFALACAFTFIAVALINEYLVQAPLKESDARWSRNYAFIEMSLRNAEVAQAMGMIPNLVRSWRRGRNAALAGQTLTSDRAAAVSSLMKFLRLAAQSLILGLGAYLVLEQLTTVGAMFAATILLGRALQPVEQLIASWRNLVAARVAYHRVGEQLRANPEMDRRVVLPRPQGDLSVEGVHFGFSTRGKLVLRGVTFELAAGEALGIVGPSGAGKSVLARHVVGTLQPTLGVVRLDGADVSLWPHEALGQHLGYLPQDIELFAGTVAANISRFQPGRDDDVIRAANLAGVHEMILKLPKGYDTEIGDGGLALSGGYRQRIALARAVFGSPSLVVLDEPSSNLDATGDSALSDCVLELKRQATTLIVISHRPATLANVDKVLVLRDGMVEGFGPRADMISRLTRPTPVDIGPRRTSETVAHSAAVGAA